MISVISTEKLFHIAVEMLDLLARLPCPRGRHILSIGVSDDANILLRGFVHGGFVGICLNEGRDFYEIVARRFCFSYSLPCLLGRIDDKVIPLFASRKMRRSAVNSRGNDLAFCRTAAQNKLLRRADHKADRRDPIRDHYFELIPGYRIGIFVAVGQQMGVHIDEARNQKLSHRLNANRILRYLYFLYIADINYHAVTYKHRLSLQHSFTIHRNDVDAHKSGRLRVADRGGKHQETTDHQSFHNFLLLS